MDSARCHECALRLRGWIPNASWGDREPQAVEDADVTNDANDLVTSSVSCSRTDGTSAGGNTDVPLDADGELYSGVDADAGLSSADCESGAGSDCNEDTISDEWGDDEENDMYDANYQEDGNGDLSDGRCSGSDASWD